MVFFFIIVGVIIAMIISKADKALKNHLYDKGVFTRNDKNQNPPTGN